MKESVHQGQVPRSAAAVFLHATLSQRSRDVNIPHIVRVSLTLLALALPCPLLTPALRLALLALASRCALLALPLRCAISFRRARVEQTVHHQRPDEHILAAATTAAAAAP